MPRPLYFSSVLKNRSFERGKNPGILGVPISTPKDGRRALIGCGRRPPWASLKFLLN